MEKSEISLQKKIVKFILWQLMKDVWKQPFKPIQWFNILYWLGLTKKTDEKYYLVKPRAINLHRIKSLIDPNLENPIFIIGSPRSGTTFLGESVAQIPEFSYHFEPPITKAAVKYIYTNEWSSRFAQAAFKFVYGGLMIRHLDTDLRFVEKNPPNCFIIPFLSQTFPSAKFIHIIRDGRDTSLSLMKKAWYSVSMDELVKKDPFAYVYMRDPDGYLYGSKARFWVEPDRTHEYESTSDPHRCIWLWRRYVESALIGFSQIPQENFHEIKYELLVTNPEQEANLLLDFMGVSNINSRMTFINYVVQNAKSDSIDQWKREFQDGDIQEMEREARGLLQKLNYL
jgi:hypothetical protein